MSDALDNAILQALRFKSMRMSYGVRLQPLPSGRYILDEYFSPGIWLSDGWLHETVERVPQSRIDEAIAMTAGESV